jgi:hypothetical protein
MLNIVNQLKFTRSEFRKGFTGVSEEEGARRFLPINSIGWMVGHLAWHEQLYWLTRVQGYTLIPELNELVAFRGPASQPSLKLMTTYWEQVTAEVDKYMDKVTLADLAANVVVDGKEWSYNQGTMLSRVIYHYWYHTERCRQYASCWAIRICLISSATISRRLENSIWIRRLTMSLSGKHVIILSENLYEDMELWYPYYRLKEEGADVKVVGMPGVESYGSKHGYPVKPDLTPADIEIEKVDALLVPAGMRRINCAAIRRW